MAKNMQKKNNIEIEVFGKDSFHNLNLKILIKFTKLILLNKC